MTSFTRQPIESYGPFVDHPDNPLWEVEGTEVMAGFLFPLVVSGAWHGYYDYYVGSDVVIGHATSTDGKKWTKDTANNPVWTGAESFWAIGDVLALAVWVEGSTWYMLYRGGEEVEVGTKQVGLATSSDGISWTNGHTAHVLGAGASGAWDQYGAEIWDIIKIGSTYYVYYNVGETAAWDANRQMGVATSTDLITWTKDAANPIMTGGRFCSTVFKIGKYYYMIVPHYTYGSDYSELELYRDTDPRFYPASREYLGVVKSTQSSGWASRDLDTPVIITDNVARNTYSATNGELWMYYSGASDTNVWLSGLAIARKENLGPSLPSQYTGTGITRTKHIISASTLTLTDASTSMLLSNLAPTPYDNLSGWGADLNGTTQYFTYSGTAFNPGTDGFSLAIAAKADTLTGQGHLFSANAPTSDVSSFGLRLLAAGNTRAFFNDGSGGVVTVTSSAKISTGTWHTWIATFDRAGNLTIWLDGVSIATADISGKTGDCVPGLMWIGQYSRGGERWDGPIAGPLYANRVLTEAEIAFLHNNGKWRRWAELGVAATDGSALTSSVILGYLGFTNLAAMGTDATGNGNTFTAYGSPKTVAGPDQTRLANLSEDTTPQLGGDLDANGNTIHFGTTENEATINTTPSPNTCTVNLGAENHWTIPANDADDDITATITVPPGPCAGRILIEQGATPRDITWTPSAGTVAWLGTEPTWTDASEASEFHAVSWTWNGTYLFLSDAGKTSITA